MDTIWYRFEDVRYAAPLNEYDEPAGPGRLVVELRKYHLTARTPKGVWLGIWAGRKDRFVLDSAHKRFACPTIEEARVSFVARKNRQRQIHQARADRAADAIVLVYKVVEKLSTDSA